MKLEDQVCSLDLAKRLKELGCKQESQFYRVKCEGIENWAYWAWNSFNEPTQLTITDKISAYTTAELGEILPAKIRIEMTPTDIWNYELTAYKTLKHFSVAYVCEERLNGQLFKADTEANARAAMLCYLLEQKIITI